MRTCRFVVITALAVGEALAQLPVFEVASVRQAARPVPPNPFAGGAKIEGDRLNFGIVSLWDLLPYAFRVKDYQIERPGWTRESIWDILAKLPAGTTHEQVPDMMRALLIDRFKIATHIEKRDQNVYQLIVAPGGPKVEISNPGDFKPWDIRGGGFGFPAGLMRTAISGRILEQADCAQRWEFVPLSISSFAEGLTMFLDKPVIDETKLQGDYLVNLDLDSDTVVAMNQNMMRGRSGLGGGGAVRSGGEGKQARPVGVALTPGQCMEAARASGGNLSLLFKAVQKLGLDLRQTRAPVDTIIVDRIERTPSEN